MTQKQAYKMWVPLCLYYYDGKMGPQALWIIHRLQSYKRQQSVQGMQLGNWKWNKSMGSAS